MQASVPVALVPSPDHRSAGHPENPDRFQHLPSLFDSPIGGRLEQVEAEPAPLDAVERVHPRSYLKDLEASVASAPALLDGGDTYVSAGSYQAALRSAGAALTITSKIISGDSSIGVSLARPPGHHATAQRALGFCLLSNLAIAAVAALDAGIDRVMIVDFDVHHGNGTQAIFESEPRIAYISFHQRGIFPGTGRLQETGRGPGEGTVMNVPLPAATGHHGYLELFRRVLPAAVHTYRPSLLMVSAGYDAHWRDPLAGLKLTCDSYFEIGRTLAAAASEVHSPIVYILEGGYDPQALFGGLLSTLAGSLHLSKPQDTLGEPGGQDADVEPVWSALKGHPLL